MFKPEHFDEFEKLLSDFNWGTLSSNPNSNEVQDWVAEVSGILWEFDSPSSTEFQEKIKNLVNMWGGVQAGTLPNYDLNHDINDIRQLLRTKLVGMRREKEKILSGEKPQSPKPKLEFGKPGQAGDAGGGGSIFIQTENLNIGGGGNISADGGNVIHSGETINFGTLNQQTAGTVNNISKLTQVVGESELEESEKRQLIGDIETIKAQVIKPRPDKKILQKAWGATKGAATIGGAAQLVKMIGEAILPLLG
jgi:hypothetical protein